MSTTRIDGFDLFYKEGGTGSAILLIHGSGSDADIWDKVFDDLAREHRVIAYDRRGFQRSKHVPVKDFHHHGEDAFALLRNLNALPATVVGWSGGGLASLDLVINHPEAVRSLVLVEPPLHVKGHMTMQMARAFVKVQFQRRLQGPIPATRTFLRWASSYTSGGSAFDRMTSEEQQAMLNTAEATMGDLDAGTGEYISSNQISKIAVPVICLLGELTTPALADATHRIVATHKKAQLIRVPGAGHAIPYDQPDKMAAAILTFINSLAMTPTEL